MPFAKAASSVRIDPAWEIQNKTDFIQNNVPSNISVIRGWLPQDFGGRIPTWITRKKGDPFGILAFFGLRLDIATISDDLTLIRVYQKDVPQWALDLAEKIERRFKVRVDVASD